MQRTDLLKKHNLLEILKTIRAYGQITKPQIASKTGLAGATVHNLVTELYKTGVIVEDGIAESNGGRKASIFRLNDSKYNMIGLNIGAEETTIMVFDLCLNVNLKESFDFALSQHSVEDGLEFIIQSIKDIIVKASLSAENILGIGISVPGPVNCDDGTIIHLVCAPNWHRIPIASIINRALDIPVHVGNDTKNSVLYLKGLTEAKENDNLILVSTTNGIGMGIIINGKLFHGSHYISGELGHISIDPNGDVCSCGNKGCIEMQASENGIVNIAKKALQNGQISTITSEKTDIHMIMEAAQNGDLFAVSLLSEASEYLSICLGNIIKAYDPSRIILCSNWLASFPEFFNSIKNSVYQTNSFINRDSIYIELNKVDDLFVRGAVEIVMDYNLDEANQSRFLETI